MKSAVLLLAIFFGARAYADLPKRIDKIRVQIFPHILTYTAPEGRESILDRVTLISQAECTTDRGSRAKEFQFQAATLTKPVLVHCTEPTQLVRTGMTSYQYYGDFLVKREFTANHSPYLAVINILPLDTYLKGVVASEMPQNWPKEAYKVQAVAARTYTYYELLIEQNHPGRDADADLDDTVFYQAYTGIPANSSMTDQAVEETSNQVMIYTGGLADSYKSKVIKAYYHSNSGGYTEDAANVFPDSVPYCIGKPEVFDSRLLPANADTFWTRSFSLATITKKLFHLGLIGSSSPVHRVAILPKDILTSGRVKFFSVDLANGDTRKVQAQAFRLALGLPSSLIDRVDLSRSDLIFEGRGSGHGVGMSQWGAWALTHLEHWDYRRVLQFYYSGISIEEL